MKKMIITNVIIYPTKNRAARELQTHLVAINHSIVRGITPYKDFVEMIRRIAYEAKLNNKSRVMFIVAPNGRQINILKGSNSESDVVARIYIDKLQQTINLSKYKQGDFYIVKENEEGGES